MNGVSIFPFEASTVAVRTDHIFLGLLAASVAVLVLVTGLIVTFSVRYRKGSKASRADLPEVLSKEFEIGWTAATAFLFLFIFWWAGSAQLKGLRAPKTAIEMHVVAKQWMWKTQAASGVREINALHVPVGMPIRLVMTSQDVIHSFYVPAFRIKQDVLPGRYTETWFQATKPGVYPLYCAEYCGTDHSAMLGKVTVMTPEDYGRWTAAQPQPDDLSGQGKALFQQLGCASCHGPNAAGRVAPNLAGVFGSHVMLSDGRIVLADEGYLRDSIVLPDKDIVAGYPPVMPSFSKSVDEEGLVTLVAYLKSLSGRSGDGS
jgi:cytochrome c oxidase subunit 2